MILLGCAVLHPASGQERPSGGRSAAMGGYGVTLDDVWSAFNNPAGLTGVDRVTAGLYHYTPFLLDELSTRGAVLAVPDQRKGVFGLSLSYYGYRLYNEKQAGLAYARRFGENLSAGLQIDYIGTYLSEGYGKGHALTFDAGFRARLTRQLVLGGHVYNPVKAKRSGPSGETLPSVFATGISYHPSDKVMLGAGVEKEEREEAVFRSGIEYRPVKALYLRAGLSTAPVTTSFGAGLVVDEFKIDLAAGHHRQLGYSPTVSLSYRFR